MNYVIIENEKDSFDLLHNLIKEYCPDLNFLATAASIKMGVKTISAHNPDLVFFDIELDDGKSFEILNKLSDIEFKVIFTTAYDQYAIKAFEYEALDYLLKPYTPSKVIKAINKAKDSLRKDSLFADLQYLLKNNTIKKESITISTSDGLEVLKISEIIRCQAHQMYCEIYLINGDKKMISKTLSDVEKLLSFTNKFFRTHASHLVSLRHVKQISSKDGDIIYMVNQDAVPLARRRKKQFLESINTLI